nr:uracil-DNA glycosylase family protein [Heyndrickxia oleronia]
MRLDRLTELYSEYQIASKECLEQEKSPYKLIQKHCGHTKYFQSMEQLKEKLPGQSEQRGADLPFWGKKYFSKSEKGLRTMIIAQDSLSEDAGSIVFYAPLLRLNWDKETYHTKFYNHLPKKTFGYNSYQDILFALSSWQLNIDFLYLTDARKVYKSNNLPKNQQKIDKVASYEFIKKEIEIVQPHLIYLLGSQAFTLFGYKGELFAEYVGKKFIEIENIPAIVAPFVTGQGKSNKRRFIERFDNTQSLSLQLREELLNAK